MDLQEIKRKYFRMNVRGNADISMKINDVEYEVIDVGDHGIGIKFSNEDIFISVGDELPIEIVIKGAVQKLHGRVVHISPTGPEEYLCGIDLINLDEKTKKEMINYLQSSRENAFKEE